MNLTVGYINVDDVRSAASTGVKDGVLYIDEKELAGLIKQDPRIEEVKVELARPGESVRIVPVKDVVEPRVKINGKGSIFPGMISEGEIGGTGRTHVLRGVAVVTSGRKIGFQEGVIDMSGPGAAYSPFSSLNNVVLVINPVEELSMHEWEAAVRLAGLKAAVYLGEAGRHVSPEEVKKYEYLPLPKSLEKYPALPRVAYVYMVQTQGLLHDTWVYGVDAKNILPTIIGPTEIMDGAIVSGNCVSACDKNTTYVHQNNPVIHDLYERHGKELNFIGVVLTNENITLAEKERSSSITTRLIEYLNPDGVIISAEGFGNPDTDLMLNCAKIESLGIKTVLITDEYAGRDGASQSLADAVPEANAVISTGNANEVIKLKPMERAIGFPDTVEVLAGGFNGSIEPDGSVSLEIQAITGSTNETGFSYLTARQY